MTESKLTAENVARVAGLIKELGSEPDLHAITQLIDGAAAIVLELHTRNVLEAANSGLQAGTMSSESYMELITGIIERGNA